MNNIPRSMPWYSLFANFAANAPHRVEQIKQSCFSSVMDELVEYRLLVVHGPRQTGKSEAGRQLVCEHEDARHVIAPVDDYIYEPEPDWVLQSRSLQASDLSCEALKDVKLLVIDAQGHPHFDEAHPYAIVEQLFTEKPRAFHPEFSIIVIA